MPPTVLLSQQPREAQTIRVGGLQRSLYKKEDVLSMEDVDSGGICERGAWMGAECLARLRTDIITDLSLSHGLPGHL